MSDDTLVAPSLLELIGRSWALPGPVGAALFNADGSTVAFAGGGELALVPVADPERPEARIRVAADTGRPTILPRSTPVRAATRAGGVVGPVTTWGEKSFLTGSTGGELVSVTPRGLSVPLRLRLGVPPAALARDPRSAAVAVGAGRRVAILPDGAPTDPTWIALPAEVAALAYSPDGRRLAVAHAEGVSLIEGGAIAGGVAIEGGPGILSFSPDGAFLACALREAGFAFLHPATLTGEMVLDYPTPIASFAWSRVVPAFATSGAFRAVAWELGPDGLAGPVHAGRNGLVIVERVAASPDRPLIAAGYANGLVCLARIGRGDEMILRPHGAAVTALTWGDDGQHLAIGSADGTAVLVSFPPSLFK